MQEDSDTPKSTLISRNITIMGRRTSVRLEPEMWKALREIANRERCSVHDICSLVHLRKKAGSSLTASIRVFLMLYFKASSTEDGHVKAGHGSFDNMKKRAGLQSSLRPGTRLLQEKIYTHDTVPQNDKQMNAGA